MKKVTANRILRLAHTNATLRRTMKTMNKEQLAYLAGLIDGEGCLTLTVRLRTAKGQKTGQPTIYISITNTHEGVLKWVEETTGIGGIYQHNKGGQWGKNSRPSFRWQMSGIWNPVQFITAIRPYLIIKAERADFLLEHIECLAEKKEEWHRRFSSGKWIFSQAGTRK